VPVVSIEHVGSTAVPGLAAKPTDTRLNAAQIERILDGVTSSAHPVGLHATATAQLRARHGLTLSQSWLLHLR
jgi:hypothetical protein